MTTQLFFNYPSTAKIKIKKENCFVSNDYPLLYGIKTDKLCFTIPKKCVIWSEKHVYIPNSIYQQELIKYYSKIKK